MRKYVPSAVSCHTAKKQWKGNREAPEVPGAWSLGWLCPFSASPQDTDEEAEVGLGPIHGREGRQLLEEDLVEVGFFPLPCHGGSKETEQ